MINLRLSVRNILRARIYFAINLLGLSVAFAISFFILSYLIHELSYNRSYDNYDRIARPLTIKKQFGWTEPSVSYPLHLKMKNDIPGIEAASILRSIRSVRVKVGESGIRVRYAYAATADILKIFTPDFIYANTEKFGEDPKSVLVSESFAIRVFGEVPDPGTVLESNIGGENIAFTIDGVFNDYPPTGTFKPEVLASFDLMKYEFPEGSYFANYLDSWHVDLFREYLLLEETADFKSVAERIAGLAEDQPDELGYEFDLQPLSRVHLFSSDLGNDGRRGDIKFVILFVAVGILILVIAISNYIILSIGSSSKRIPEISTRKIFGARSSSVRSFILFESILICLVSLPLAYIIVRLASQDVESLFNISMELSREGNILVFVLIFALIIITGLLSGSYLAGKLGKTSPTEVLNRSSRKGGGRFLYKSLITLQIVIFVSLLSGSFVILRQISYSKNHDPGFNHDNLLKTFFPSGMVTDFNALRYELKKNPNIIEVSFGGLLPPTSSAMVSIIKEEDGGEDIRIEGISADYEFVKATGIEIIGGRDFNSDLASDSTATIINETLAERLGADPDKLHELKSLQNVIGIMKDIQIHSAREEIGPMTLQISKGKYISDLIARVNPGTETDVKEYINEVFKEYNPRYIEIASYDEVVSGMYGEESRFGIIVMVFGVIALIVAMMGVFGLSLFLSNEQRFNTAIYRVFGASGGDIIFRNTWHYMLFVVLGNIISVPLVVIAMTRWLQQFAFRISLNPWIFIAAFLLSALVFIFTTLINTLRLSNLNPVNNLRQE